MEMLLNLGASSEAFLVCSFCDLRFPLKFDSHSKPTWTSLAFVSFAVCLDHSA